LEVEIRSNKFQGHPRQKVARSHVNQVKARHCVMTPDVPPVWEVEIGELWPMSVKVKL
jgi:hypothetical protein